MHPNTPPEFTPWPKIARLNRDCIVTEKIDGTNAAVVVRPEDDTVWSQSRKKVITPESDNFGFARWVFENSDLLREILGYGIHFGEWYGQGIQRNYGLVSKRFMLFNTSQWGDPETRELLRDRSDGRVEVSTVLHQGEFSTSLINGIVNDLRSHGSYHVPGFMNPEGVVVYHVAAGISFKVTTTGDESPKSISGA